MAQTFDELPGWAGELLCTARVGHMGLLDESGYPRVLPVTFALVQGAAWTVVDEKPKRRHGEQLARVRWLRARPRSTLTVDRYDDDWTRLAWVQLVGDAMVLDAAAHRPVLGALAERYQQYRSRTPPGPLICLVPQRIVCWRAAEHRPDSAA